MVLLGLGIALLWMVIGLLGNVATNLYDRNFSQWYRVDLWVLSALFGPVVIHALIWEFFNNNVD